MYLPNSIIAMKSNTSHRRSRSPHSHPRSFNVNRYCTTTSEMHTDRLNELDGISR